MHFQGGGDKAAARDNCFSTRDGGTDFPHRLSHASGASAPQPRFMDRSEVSCTIHVPWDTCKVPTIRLAISSWVHRNASLSTEMESSGKRLGTCPQDFLLGLSHLLKVEGGDAFGYKMGSQIISAVLSLPRFAFTRKSFL